MMKSGIKGFTLIELVIVIVILGILSVTAAPRFINLSDNARVATVDSLSGSLTTAVDLIFTKAVVEGKQQSLTATVDYSGTNITTFYGLPSDGDFGILSSMNLDFSLFSPTATSYDSVWVAQVTATGLNIFRSDSSFSTVGNEGCRVAYDLTVNPTAGTSSYSVSKFTDDC